MRFCQRSRSSGSVAQQDDRQQDQVVEIDRIVGAQGALVGAVQRGEEGVDDRLPARLVAASGSIRSFFHAEICRRARCRVSLSASFFFDSSRSSCSTSCSSKMLKPRRSPAASSSRRRMFRPEGVEGRDGQAARLLGHPAACRHAPFISRAALLVKVTAVMWRAGDAGVVDQVGDLGRDHPGLAGAGAGQHQQRPVEVADRLALSAD